MTHSPGHAAATATDRSADTCARPLSPGRWLAGLGVTAAAFGALDGVWLGVIARETYQDLLGPLLADPMNGVAGAVFYGIYTVGVTHFATAPGLASRSVRRAAGQGAALGLIAYSTFDLTNLAVLEGYPVQMVLIDIAWGTVATSAAAAVATAILKGRR